MKNQKILVISLSLLVAAFIVVGCITDENPPSGSDQGIKKFASAEELSSFIEENQGSGSYNTYGSGARQNMMAEDMAVTGAAAPAAEKSVADGGTSDYSQTNVQVEGVDEADIVKSDGKYIYVVGQQVISIIDAYPAESAQIISNISINGTVQNIYINGDKLIAFGYSYEQEDSGTGTASSEAKIAMPRYWNPSKMFIKVYDVSDRANPVIKRDLKMDGSYFDSRMIGDYAYIIINQPIVYNDGIIPLPMIYSGGVSMPMFEYRDIYYFPYPDYSYRFTDIVSVNIIDDGQEIASNPYLLGDAQDMYVSQNNIYITGMKQFNQYYFYEKVIQEVIIPLMPFDIQDKINVVNNMDISKEAKLVEIQSILSTYQNTLSTEERNAIQNSINEKQAVIQAEMEKERQKTIINKISINNGKVEFKATGEVPGSPLNQFSMDENGDYFRIATTVGGIWTSRGETKSSNNIYVLDSDLKVTGKIEDIAPGETIYSARFMGDRAYLVTFKRVDPLFVIDLSDPTNPRILGKLKIPGYSDYLHPYDENHIIGIGKEVDESIDADKVHSEDAVYYTAVQGVKIAIFDVTDVENPIEMSKYVIGDRGTDSEALNDHKAFLFDREKNLLVIPILLAENKNKTADYYGDFTFQGAYVFNVNLDSGITLKGRITHVKDDSLIKSGYYYSSPYSVKRSMYIDNNLYTLSEKMLKINALSDLSEIKEVDLPYTEPYYGPYYGGGFAEPMMAVE